MDGILPSAAMTWVFLAIVGAVSSFSSGRAASGYCVLLAAQLNNADGANKSHDERR